MFTDDDDDDGYNPRRTHNSRITVIPPPPGEEPSDRVFMRSAFVPSTQPSFYQGGHDTIYTTRSSRRLDQDYPDAPPMPEPTFGPVDGEDHEEGSPDPRNLDSMTAMPEPHPEPGPYHQPRRFFNIFRLRTTGRGDPNSPSRTPSPPIPSRRKGKQRAEPEPYHYAHPARDDPNFPPFDIFHFNRHPSEIWDRDKNPVLAAHSRTPSLEEFTKEMWDLRREARWDRLDRERAAQGLPPIDRAKELRKMERFDEWKKENLDVGEMYWRQKVGGPPKPELHYVPPPLPDNMPSFSSEEEEEQEQKRRRPGLGRYLSLKRVVGNVVEKRGPLEPDLHPIPDPYEQHYFDPNAAREVILEPYMEAQASVAGTPPPGTQQRASRGPGPGASRLRQQRPESEYVETFPPLNPRPPNYHRDPAKNVYQPVIYEVPVPEPFPESIPPPPTPPDSDPDYTLRHERWRVPKPSWNAFGGVLRIPRWRRRQQDVDPDPYTMPVPDVQVIGEELAYADHIVPDQEAVSPSLHPSSPSTEETLTPHSAMPPELQPSPQIQPGPSMPTIAPTKRVNPESPPIKPSRQPLVVPPAPSPPSSRPDSGILQAKQARTPSFHPLRQSLDILPDRSQSSSPGFDRSLSTASLPSGPRFTPFHSHVEKARKVLREIAEMPWMAERVTADWVPSERTRPKRESQALEYVAPPPKESTSWYNGGNMRRRSRYKERLVTLMFPRFLRAPARHTLYLSDTTMSDRAQSPTMLDHANVSPTVIPVHTGKGRMRHVSLRRGQQVHIVQSSYPPTSTSYPYPTTATGNMVGSDGRVYDYVPQQTYFVLPTQHNPLPTPPTFTEPDLVFSPRSVRIRERF